MCENCHVFASNIEINMLFRYHEISHVSNVYRESEKKPWLSEHTYAQWDSIKICCAVLIFILLCLLELILVYGLSIFMKEHHKEEMLMFRVSCSWTPDEEEF